MASGQSKLFCDEEPAPGAAAHAVFHNYELLETILNCLERDDIRIAQTVAKAWHEVPTRSKRIREIRCINNYYFANRLSDVAQKDDAQNSLALVYYRNPSEPGFTINSRFSIHAQVSVNPLFETRVVQGPQFERIWMYLPTLTPELLDKVKHQYITEPPMGIAYVQTDLPFEKPHFQPHEDNVCSVKRSTGVTVLDVVHARRAMLKSMSNREPCFTFVRFDRYR